MTPLSALMIGNESLLVRCAELWLGRGHAISAVATRSAEVRAWAEGRGLRVLAQDATLGDRLAPGSVDWLFSIANLALIPETVLAAARKGAINFHDGPLPAHAGLNAPVWALLQGEARHGVTWHLIGGGIDEGDIVAQALFDIAPDETALTLNSRCWEAAVESFAGLVAALERGGPERRPQDLSRRTFHARADRPAAAARIDFRRPAGEVARLVRALDHGPYRNPLACPKIEVAGRVLLVRAAAVEAAPAAPPGTVIEASPAGLMVACGAGAVRLQRLSTPEGAEVCPGTLEVAGTVLPSPDAAEAARLTALVAALAPGEGHWRRRLAAPEGAGLPGLAPARGAPDWQALPLALPAGLAGDRRLAAVAAWAARVGGRAAADIAFRDAAAPVAPGYVSGWVPLSWAPAAGMDFDAAAAAFAATLPAARRWPGFAADLPAREPGLSAAPPEVGVSLAADGAIAGTALTVHLPEGGAPRALYDAARLDPETAAALAASLEALAAHVAGPAPGDCSRLPLMTAAARDRLLFGLNATAAPVPPGCLHEAVAAQAARTPQAPALAFGLRTLSYAELDARANRLAQVLRGMGVGPGTVVGLCTRRAPEMVIGALGILKAGGAYLPLDPAYPADRLALYLEDSGAAVIVAQRGLALPPHAARVLEIDADPRIGHAPATPPEGGAAPGDLAYLIYTSGSTGRPKGVMVTHRNVMNFLAAMDARIPHDPPGVWLAVTSLSFDISVLELFWTLARGFKVVLSGDEDRALVSKGRLPLSGRKVDFSLYYWGNDDGQGRDKYRLLLEGARFADARGFRAVWTPERHFHAFGGPYPNPSVTGAAVAAVTRTLDVRAGSVVAPLHHPARIAEEWAVIDNLTNGRAGIAIASGWQPDDFLLRPETAPPRNKAAMFEALDQVRRLWRGEAVAFPTASGRPHAVVTQPRPVSPELPVWVTTAGNPETWAEAGRLGANVLTHLLGQSIAEVGEKIAVYRAALAAAGHDPERHCVTLMLHTFLSRDRSHARAVAKGPMKAYLRSAAGLIKDYAWAFPAFKRPAGIDHPADIDLGTLSEDELEAILDFAFARYFDDSGLFGTVEDALDRVEQLRRIGVDEVACLIDFGSPVETVLEGLHPLAEVVARANAPAGLAADDFSIAAQILRHGVTHMQCTPSMARMIAMDDQARAALGRLRHLMLGGEALPGRLVAELAGLGVGQILNMYGPTETTIWSTTGPAEAGATVAGLGTPIANTRLYVLDDAGEPVPPGLPGELWIGGEGVARGYWNRPELTAERFRPDPFAGQGRMYRTGDLVRRRADGGLDFLGRADAQVKLRGHRIEPGEIEAVLEALPGVRQAAVVLREDTPGDARLVAYVTGSADPEALRAALAGRLPPHMVPAHVVGLAAMPLTPNRKLDRKALPAPQALAAPAAAAGPGAGPGAGHEAPAGAIAQAIAAVWARVLGQPRVGLRDNFFALGGHSLLAVQAHREIRAALGTERLSITDIFRFPVLADLAAHLGEPAPPAAAAEAAAPAAAGRAEARAEAMARRRALRAARAG